MKNRKREYSGITQQGDHCQNFYKATENNNNIKSYYIYTETNKTRQTMTTTATSCNKGYLRK